MSRAKFTAPPAVKCRCSEAAVSFTDSVNPWPEVANHVLYQGVPPVPRNDGCKSANSPAAKVCFQAASGNAICGHPFVRRKILLSLGRKSAVVPSEASVKYHEHQRQ